MEMAFQKVLSMSISASWLVLAVLILRFLLKKSPKWISVALWALVAVRLVCPFSFESVMSMVPERTTEQIVESISGGYYGDAMIYSQGSANYEAAVAAGVTPSVGDDGYRYVLTQADDPTKPVQTVAALFGRIWIAGIGAMLLHALISYFRLRRKVDASVDVGNGVYICDYIDTPFILGILKPKIYLPSSMDPDAASHVLAHERAHIARKDHWWKPFGYLLLTIYWFNPVLWLAYILLCRDIELACDEKVIREMELPQKKAYSEALLSCSVNRRMIAACPLAFGEVGVKERVKTVLNYKKPAFWIVLVAVLALIITAVCFLTDPVKEETRTYRVEEVVYRNPAISYYMTEEEAPMFQIAGDNILRAKEHDGAWKDLGEFSKIKISDLNFEELFFGLQGQPREDNQEVWMLAVPPEETANSTHIYLLFRQENGVLYLGEGIAFTNVYPLHENILDATCNVNWLYRLKEADSAETGENESPYTWTSTLEVSDLLWCSVSLGRADWAADSVEGAELAEFVQLLNQLTSDQIQVRKPEGEQDPLWVLDGIRVDMSTGDGIYILLRHTQDTLILKANDDSGLWKTDGYWVIESQELKDWMQNVSYGNATMLSEENREEIMQLLRTDYVEYFSPQEYDDLLFVGCQYDGGRGMGVAVFQKVVYGYKLVVLLRDEEVKRCASGSDLYYCDYSAYRAFLIMNRNVTGLEWAGAYEADYAIDSHPGLIVEHFPENLGSMYRFCYSGGATTMYMDWKNQTHGQVPDYTKDVFANPGVPHSVFTNVQMDHVDRVWAYEMIDLGNGNYEPNMTELDADETVQLLDLLHNLPEEAFALSDNPDAECRILDIYIHNYSGQQRLLPIMRFKLWENGVYYMLLPDSLGGGQIWKIDAPELAEYIDSFFVEDKSD